MAITSDMLEKLKAQCSDKDSKVAAMSTEQKVVLAYELCKENQKGSAVSLLEVIEASPENPIEVSQLRANGEAVSFTSHQPLAKFLLVNKKTGSRRETCYKLNWIKAKQ